MGVQEFQQQQYCPDLTLEWHLGQKGDSDHLVLSARDGSRQLLFSPTEGFALRYFTGAFTLAQVQQWCEQEFEGIASNFVAQLMQSLVNRKVLSDAESEVTTPPREFLKPGVHWIEHPEGYWILRNPQDVTFLQVSAADQHLLRQLESFTPAEVMQREGVTVQEISRLLHLLAATGMLVGTSPAKAPKHSRLNPLQLLFFRVPLVNPDRWLTHYVDYLRWIWTLPVAWLLAVFLIASLVVGWNVQAALVATGQKLWATQGGMLLVPFILLCGVVVALHELAHAFTLKHYGGIVPEIGLLMICLMPGCYTNTTDSYCLTRRRQRLLVVDAGILCQLVLAGVALWLWFWLTPGTWLKTSSYLLLGAALLTLAVNLNPLAKFDGYYLAVAFTGINNLRSRSFLLYANLLRRRPLRERGREQVILALYAPLSLLYTLLVFGHLLGWLVSWCLTHIPTLSLALLLLWALAHVLPAVLSQASTMTSRPFHPQVRVPFGLPPNSVRRSNQKSQGSDPAAGERSHSTPPVSQPPDAIAHSKQPQSDSSSEAIRRSHPASEAIAHPKQPQSLFSPEAIAPPKGSQATEAIAPSQHRGMPKRWLMVGAMALGLVGIGLIPLTDTVTGEATILSTPGQRQVVTMGRSARVNAIYVRQNDRVRVGQLLAELSSDELQQQSLEVERKLAEARAERETARQYLNLALEKGVGAQMKTQHGALRANLLREELAGVAKGEAPPRIRQLQSQQTEKQRQIEGTVAQLAILKDEIQRYEGLVQEGALPLAKLDEVRREAISLQTQQAALKAQVDTLEQQIATTRKEMYDELAGRRLPEVEEAGALVKAGQQEVAAAQATVQKWEAQIWTLEGQQQQLRSQQEGLKLRATVAGVVTTPDLDVLEGQKLPEGKEVLTIAQVTQPTVMLELPQSEAQRVKVGMPVTVRLQDEGLTGYPAKVQEIPPITAPDNPQQPQQKAMVKIRVQLEEQPVVALGTKGYAHVQLGQIRLYQKGQRELLKLFPVGRFF